MSNTDCLPGRAGGTPYGLGNGELDARTECHRGGVLEMKHAPGHGAGGLGRRVDREGAQSDDTARRREAFNRRCRLRQFGNTPFGEPAEPMRVWQDHQRTVRRSTVVEMHAQSDHAREHLGGRKRGLATPSLGAR